MSELAFNINGERFEVPPTAASWRVRRLKPGGRGAPEVVFGSDGLPLIVPIEIDMEELRRLVDNAPGRYRLDAVDADQNACEEAIAAYVQVSEGAAAASGGDDRDALVRDLVRANSEMVRSIAERFAQVMESAAVLLRAADGAGLPRREPAPPLAAPASAEEDDEEPPSRSELAELLAQLMPFLVQRLGGAKPAGGEKVAAPALAGSAGRVGQPATSAAAGGNGSAATRGEGGRNTAGAANPAGMAAHFAAIQARLTPREAALAQAAAQELSPEEIQGWMAQLAELTVDDAVALVRKTIAGGGDDEVGS